MSTLDDRLAALDARSSRRCPASSSRSPAASTPACVLAAAVRTLGAGAGRRGHRRLARACRRPSAAPAAAFAASLGVRHELPRTDELSREGYVANAGDRCAFCKTELVDVLTPAGRPARASPTSSPAPTPTTCGPASGPASARPPSAGAWAPLARAGMTKDDVRAAARRWGLPLADKPAAACLASRIAYGVPVSAEGLARVEAAEAGLRAALAGAGLPVRNLRVRDLGDDVARVEVDARAGGPTLARRDLLGRP